MIKLKTQLTATVSQKDIEVIIRDIINKQLGASTVIGDTVFSWNTDSVTVTGTQQDLSKVDTSNKVTVTSEVPFDVVDTVLKQPVATAQEEQHRLPFAPIEKESIFKQVDTVKKELGITNTSSFPSVTNKFLVQ